MRPTFTGRQASAVLAAIHSAGSDAEADGIPGTAHALRGAALAIQAEVTPPAPPELPPPGAKATHQLPDGGWIEMMHEGVYIYDADGNEVTCWVDVEWANLEAVTATLNAISLALQFGADAVRRRIARSE